MFYSDHCGPCNAIRPVLETMVKEYGLLLEKVCVDQQIGSQHAYKHQVLGWPTIFLVKDDIIIAESKGADVNGSGKDHRDRLDYTIFSHLNSTN